jgi:biotin-[acetyl-CoA-carboxylase] ligase BirA-like protein
MNFEILHFDSLDSTNEEAKRLLNSGMLSSPFIIHAKAQTAGKGTQGRKWISPEGAGLYFSIVHPFENNHSIPVTPLLTIAAGIACAKAIEELTQLKIQLKPINDLYLESRKLGGILTESMISNGQCRGLITGIGINILKHEEIISGCENEQRGNQPISLQEGLTPLHFSQWQPEQIAQEIMLHIATQIELQYQKLFDGQAQYLVDEYSIYKMVEYPLPQELNVFQKQFL